MLQTLIVLLAIGLVGLGIFIQPWLAQRQRRRLQNRLFPARWRALVECTLPMYGQLSADERRRLQGHIQVFLAEKQFIGCQGLVVTEEMRLTVAAVACLLLLNERGSYFSQLKSILLYPDAYLVNQSTTTMPYIVEERQEVRLGESWSKDQVILSWEEIKADMKHWQDGHNLVLHEFAHQLDQENGQAQGVPVLKRPTDYSQWAEVMRKEYKQLYYAVQQNRATVMDGYGAINPAEFFAVATESFFEKPLALQAYHPALYDQLKGYYQVDPVQWELADRLP